MHPLYADIFDVTLLKLNGHYCAHDSDIVDNAADELTALSLNEQFWADIQQASEQKLTQVFQAREIAIQAESLFLPSQNLTAQQKRQLWELLCD